MKLLFASAQIVGHLDWGGYLQTAVELQRRGHSVLWASGREVATTVGAAGVNFHQLTQTGWRWPPPPPLGPNAAPDEASLRRLKQERALDQWLDVERVSQATEEFIQLASEYRPDLIVSELFCSAAGLAAEKLDVPFVVAGWPAPVDGRSESTSAMSPMVELARDRLNELLRRFELDGRNWTKHGPPSMTSPTLHMTYWSDTWYHGQPTGPQTRHVGGIKPSQPREAPSDLPSPNLDPWVLITLGTSFNRDVNFFVNAAQAAHQMGCLPLVAVGSDLSDAWVQGMIPRLPRTSVLRERVNFAATLPYTAAAIHHGGAGTSHALVIHGVPQVVTPHAADQTYQARGVHRSGVGIHIPPRRGTIDSYRIALSAILPDRSTYRAAAVRLQTEFHELGGVPVAANLVENQV